VPTTRPAPAEAALFPADKKKAQIIADLGFTALWVLLEQGGA